MPGTNLAEYGKHDGRHFLDEAVQLVAAEHDVARGPIGAFGPHDAPVDVRD